MNSSDRSTLDLLLASATPFLRINDVKREDWCRIMQKPKDPRIGPWKYTAVYEVLDQRHWDRPGEVIYFVTDSQGSLRLVGQSMSKLNVRWKRAPMYDIASRRRLGGRKALFHTTSWPAIELGFDSERPPFTVSALFRDRLELICRASAGPLQEALRKLESHRERLSFHVESWVCSLDYGDYRLWNKQKVPRTSAGKRPNSTAEPDARKSGARGSL